jgi:hypothetical protein
MKIAELDEAGWNEWVATRPPIIQEMCRRLPPDRLYRIKDAHRCTIVAYSEDGTVRVNVSGEHNFLMFDREVFGINPNDLTECDLPDENEVVGTMIQEP